MSTIVSDLVSHLQCGEALSALDAVYISNVDGKIYKYSPLDQTQVFAGIAKEAGLLNAFIRVVQSGRVKGFTGLTPGKFVYASVTVPGGFQLTEPGATSKVVLGIAKSATELTVNGALGIKTGGDGTGSGSLDTILQLTATEQLADWSTGNNATVLAGGVLAGSFVKETSTPLHGSESYKYTQAAGSLNDYFLSKSFPVDVRFRGQQVYFSAPIQYDGNTGDIQIIIYDVTNATVLTTLSNSVIATNGATQTVIASALLPLTCENIRVGFQVKVLNSGKVFQFDDIQLSSNLNSIGTITNLDLQTSVGVGFSAYGATNTKIPVYSTVTGVGSGIISISNTAALGYSITALRDCEINISAYGAFTVASNLGLSLNASGTANISALTTELRGFSSSSAAGQFITTSASIRLIANDVLRVHTDGTSVSSGTLHRVSVLAKAPSQSIVTPTQQISSDTLPFTFKATAIVDADPIGTFNTYTYASGGNVATISASAPTQTALDMNTNGVRVFSRAYNATSTTASPARVDIKIGKGLKAHTVDAYAAVAKVNPLSYDYMTPTSSVEVGILVFYDEVSGVLTLNAAQLFSTATTIHHIGMARTEIYQTNAYFVFNASTTPSIAALPILQPRIATLSDVKASGTAGGSAGAATTQTRVLNTLVDPTGIVTSLTANQFTLPAGTYYIEGFANAYLVNAHRTRVRNITDSTTSILGSSEQAGSSTPGAVIKSLFSGEVTIATPKVFELQHYTQTAAATNGLGLAASSGESEVYSLVKITRIRGL